MRALFIQGIEHMWKFVVALAVLLSACAPMPQKFDLPASKDKGLLVASVRLEGLPEDASTIFGWTTITYREEGALLAYGDGAVSSRDGGIKIEGEKFAKLNVIALSPGNYRFWLVKIGGLEAKLEPPLRFTINPGRATYVGMMRVRTQAGFTYRLRIADEQERDIPLLMKNWPGVPRDAIDVQLLQQF
jgi:hypothetical protein